MYEEYLSPDYKVETEKEQELLNVIRALLTSSSVDFEEYLIRKVLAYETRLNRVDPYLQTR